MQDLIMLCDAGMECLRTAEVNETLTELRGRPIDSFAILQPRDSGRDQKGIRS